MTAITPADYPGHTTEALETATNTLCDIRHADRRDLDLIKTSPAVTMSRSNATTTDVAQTHTGTSQGHPVPAEPTPLNFDSEADLLALLDRMRSELEHRVTDAVERAQRGDKKGKNRAKEPVDRAKVDDLVQKVDSLSHSLPVDPRCADDEGHREAEVLRSCHANRPQELHHCGRTLQG